MPIAAANETDKWAPFRALSPYGQATCDRMATERGEIMHAGSTAEEIARAVRIYKASW